MEGKTILVVEDRRDLRLVLASMLKLEKYRVLEAADGGTGMKLFRQKSPDAVLLDINLPDTDGYALCREMRADPERGKVPIIFITGRAAPEDRISGLRTGADYYITKPFDPDEVLRRIEAVLRRAPAP